MSKKINRRTAIVAAGVTGVGLAVGAAALEMSQHSSSQVQASNDTVPFYDTHQAGIVTPAQNHLHFAAFDLLTEQYSDVRSLMQIWTSAAATMTNGHPIGEGAFPSHAPPPDTGEALNLQAANLTITFGFGPTLFTLNGKDRYGLASRRPAPLIDIPPMAGDALQTERSGGDLCVQACSDNPQVAFHAVRNLARLARGLAVMRWSQLGFNRTASTSQTQETPRNLMGFKDGTNNLKAEDKASMDQHVWVSSTDTPSWMRNGTYLVVRRIRMHLEAWDRDFLSDQENVIGRHKVSGAPLNKQNEFDPIDLTVLPTNAHVRLARGDNSIKILRRGYSFTDGMDTQTGELDAGLFFIAFQRDSRTQFVPLQHRLASDDALNEYITHVGSAIFACPPGTHSAGFIGETLFNL
ncbi:MAG TPA: iron uptake transporter deferrochelatase/peroxidase subunit [Ktedonobacteraceae bacterium]|nr:iron uptake transporter deferrochelatase/peroxidase subunit [Ktedonobacteraceae bacterium]